MKTHSYCFISTWKFKCPIEPLWNTIYDFENWPSWWEGVQEAVVIDKGVNGTGTKVQYKWTTMFSQVLTLQINIRHIDPYHLLEGTVNGDVEGIGLWKFTEAQEITTIVGSWDINTNKKWINTLSPLLKPLFSWHNRRAMRMGAKGLARKLNIELLN